MRFRFSSIVATTLIALLWSSPLAAADAGFLSVTNADRAAVSVAPLGYSPALNNAAAAKLADMFAGNYWAHVSPSGHDAGYFIDASSYHWVAWAENLAYGYTSSTTVVAAWMNSPGHKTNMLNASYREVGFAIGSGTINGQETTLAVALYGSQVQGPTAPIAAPTPPKSTTPPQATPTKPPQATKTANLPPSTATPSPKPPTPSLTPSSRPSPVPLRTISVQPSPSPQPTSISQKGLTGMYKIISKVFATVGSFLLSLFIAKK